MDRIPRAIVAAWLLSYYGENGFAMERLHARESLPGLVRALEGDPLTHGLAGEQISVITGTYFGEYAPPRLLHGGMAGGSSRRERMNIRVRLAGGARPPALGPVAPAYPS